MYQSRSCIPSYLPAIFVEMAKVRIQLHVPNLEGKKYYEDLATCEAIQQNPVFLQIEHCSFDPFEEGFLMNVQFKEIAKSLAEIVLGTGETVGFEATLDLIEAVLAALSSVEATLPDYSFPSKAIYQTCEGSIKLCPFLELAEAPARNSALKDISTRKGLKVTSEMRNLAAEIVEKAAEMRYEEVGVWVRMARKKRKPELVENLNNLIEKYPHVKERMVKDLLTMQGLIAHVEFDQNCSICREQSAAFRFPCGHFACIQCQTSNSACPKCPIGRRKPQKAKASEALDPVQELKCMECGNDLPSDPRLFSCKAHGFCSGNCMRTYISKYFPHDSWFPVCLFCNRYEEAAIAHELIPNGESLVARLADLKKRCLASKGEDFAVCVALADAASELGCMSNSLVQTSPQWPLCLSHLLLLYSCYALRCCYCQNNTFVHKRNANEMGRWGDRPFLIKCDFKLHAVCSNACFRKGACPICPGSRIHDWLLEGKEHKTIEALRRSAGIACFHDRVTTPLRGCSHELCDECIQNQQQEHGYTCCPICWSQSDFSE